MLIQLAKDSTKLINNIKRIFLIEDSIVIDDRNMLGSEIYSNIGIPKIEYNLNDGAYMITSNNIISYKYILNDKILFEHESIDELTKYMLSSTLVIKYVKEDKISKLIIDRNININEEQITNNNVVINKIKNTKHFNEIKDKLIYEVFGE